MNKVPAGKNAVDKQDDSGQASTATDVSDSAVDVPLIGLGASAGGLQAFTDFLEAMPDGSGMAFVLIQHLDP